MSFLKFNLFGVSRSKQESNVDVQKVLLQKGEGSHLAPFIQFRRLAAVSG
jgi:hypothetical protein